MTTYGKVFVVILGIALGGTMWVVAMQSESIAKLTATTKLQQATLDTVRHTANSAATNVELTTTKMNFAAMLEGQRQELGRELDVLRQSVDNLAAGVRDLVALKNSVTSAEGVLTEATTKVAAVEAAVRDLIVRLEESRRGETGETGATVLSPEDRVLATIEVGAIIDRLEAEIRHLHDELGEAHLLLEDVKRTQAADKEGD